MQVRDPTEPGKATVAGRFVTVGREKKRPSGRLFRTAHQHEHEARAFLDDLKERMRKFELALHIPATAGSRPVPSLRGL